MESKIESVKAKKRKSSRPDRVNLDQEAYEKVNGWVIEVNERFQNIIKVSRSDMANVIIKQHSDKLSPSDLKAIREDNFDDTKFALWMAKELQRRKVRGENITYESLFKSVRTLLRPRETKRSSKKTLSKTEKSF